MSIAPGQPLPTGELHEGSPGKRHDPAKLFAEGRHVLFAVPGAFTPGCSQTHLPGFIADHATFKQRGVDSVNCLAVNDAFVMAAWGEAHGAQGKVRMLADPAGDYTKSLGLGVEAKVLGGLRSKRYAMLIEDGVVKALQVEPDGFGLTCSLSGSLLDNL
ncbi:MAG: peroxiredoxin [Deltaproteobacteria bacterium]|nr:MAG: peroxiredoxin [Deltaproteobacteria bacterium]